MTEPNNMSQSKTISPFGILLDILLIALAYGLNNWLPSYHEVGYYLTWTLGILQVVTLFHFFSTPDWGKALFENPVGKKLGALNGLIMILSFGGFFWFYLPALIYDDGGAWGSFTANFIISLFGSLLAFGWSLEWSDERKIKFQKRSWSKALYLAPTLYLGLSEFYIFKAAHHPDIHLSMALFCISLSWLPIRYILLMRPPFHWLEFGSAITALTYFIYTLF
jgi:hypothetical protein